MSNSAHEERLHRELMLQTYCFAAGPMDKTLDDFWLMVWLQRANRIVMVTKLIEGGLRVGELMMIKGIVITRL